MNSYQEKTVKNTRKSVANEVIQQQASSPAFQFEDNRPAAISQLKVKELLSRKQTSTQLKSNANQVIQLNGNIAASPTIASITEAFPVLGKKTATQYAKINHGLGAASPLKSLLKTFKARLAVLKLFRKALLANGINGAKKATNQRFRGGEAGHIQAMMQLKALIAVNHAAAAARLPTAGQIRTMLTSVKMTKQQIK